MEQDTLVSAPPIVGAGRPNGMAARGGRSVAWFQQGSGKGGSSTAVWRSVASVLLAILGGCAAPAPPSEAPPPLPPPVGAKPIAAVLAGGDASIPVFDHAIEYLHDLLAARNVEGDRIALLSASRDRPPDEEFSALPTLQARLQATRPEAGGSCLVYLTSHGGPEHGLYLAASNGNLMPGELDHALQIGCGEAPTVVIVSACFSGQFVTPAMARPNRIILTAARQDRTSFGCGAGFSYTYFDECLIGALPDAADWHQVYDRARGCVSQREGQIEAQPSEPQAWFGEAVQHLPAPFAPRPGAAPMVIRFIAGPLSYRASQVPIDRGERQREGETLKSYGDIALPKALAITPAGFTAIMSRAQDESASEDDVARLAVQRCELVSGGACILYARDNMVTRVLPSGQAPFHPELLQREGTLDPARTPFIRDDQRPEIARYLTLPEPKALALSPGHAAIGIGSGETPEAARADAQQRCEAAGKDCLIYAEGERVVLGWPQ
jgi:hypothetical protein